MGDYSGFAAAFLLDVRQQANGTCQWSGDVTSVMAKSVAPDVVRGHAGSRRLWKQLSGTVLERRYLQRAEEDVSAAVQSVFLLYMGAADSGGSDGNYFDKISGMGTDFRVRNRIFISTNAVSWFLWDSLVDAAAAVFLSVSGCLWQYGGFLRADLSDSKYVRQRGRGLPAGADGTFLSCRPNAKTAFLDGAGNKGNARSVFVMSGVFAGGIAGVCGGILAGRVKVGNT